MRCFFGLILMVAVASPATAQYYRIPGDGVVNGSRYSSSYPGSASYRYAYPGGNPYYPGSSLPRASGSIDRGAPILLPEPPPLVRDRAQLTVRLPRGDTELTVNGEPTRQSGRERTFVTPPLTPGRSYVYRLRAVWSRDGQTREQERSVQVQDGMVLTVDFAVGGG
jgi:uncharacterized protein (TIGR03000 family)